MCWPFLCRNMEEKFFNTIFMILPQSKEWTRPELFKQLQFEYVELRELTREDFDHALNLLIDANIINEKNEFLAFTKNGRHIQRLNYNNFTMKHLEFHREHGAEYMVRYGGDDTQEVGN